MDDSLETEKITSVKTLVIGGGQAGLAVGYYLKKKGEEFLILDAENKTGNSWKKRWNSLRLFTPNWANGLPGFPFPGDPQVSPTKDEVAAYLLEYRNRFALPVQYLSRVTSLTSYPEGFLVQTENQNFLAKNVIIATGNYNKPKIPAFAKNLNPSIYQLHSSFFTSSKELPEGDVLIAGAGTSGLQISLDLLEANRKVYISGNPPLHLPDFIFDYLGKPFVWFATNILNTATPIGRKAQKRIWQGGGAPLISISLQQVLKAGALHKPRVTGVQEGQIQLNNSELLNVPTLIWATGFTPDTSWIYLPGAIRADGFPISERGVSTLYSGLYFMGSLFQYGLTSTWLGGVGRDAAFVSNHLAGRNS